MKYQKLNLFKSLTGDYLKVCPLGYILLKISSWCLILFCIHRFLPFFSACHPNSCCKQQLQKTFPYMFSFVLVHLNCCKKVPQSLWFLNNRNIFLTVLEPGKSKIKAPADVILVSAPSGAQGTVFSVCLHMLKSSLRSPLQGHQSHSWQSFLITPQSPHFQILLHRRLGFTYVSGQGAEVSSLQQRVYVCVHICVSLLPVLPLLL